MNRRLLFIIPILLGAVAEISAQLVTDRPDQTESSSTVPFGALQIESGLFLAFDGDSPVSARQLLLPTTLFRYGLTRGIEIRVLSQFESLKTADEKLQGISDLGLGTKIQLLKGEGRNTEIALLAQVTIPSGTAEVAGERTGLASKLSVSHALGDNAGIGYNIGYDHPGEEEGFLTWSLAFGFRVNEKVGVYVEPYGETASFGEMVANINAGFTCLVVNNLQFDFSFGTGLNHRMNFLSMGCSWLIERE